MDHAHERLSRRINAALYGDPCQMFCARAWRSGWWPLVVCLDLWFLARHGEGWGHCKRIARREYLRRLDGLDDRYRASEGIL